MDKNVTGIFDLSGLKISNKEVQEFEFSLNNPNEHQITITSFSTSCGCTAVKPGQSILQPGNNTITVTVDKRGQTGMISQVVNLVLSNNQKITLSLTGNLE